MEVVKHDYLIALQSELEYLREIIVTNWIANQNSIWYIIFPNWAYSPELEKLAPTQNLSHNILYDIQDFLTYDLIKDELEMLQYRISHLNSIYHYIKRCNPTLDNEKIGNLVVANLEQNYNEHKR